MLLAYSAVTVYSRHRIRCGHPSARWLVGPQLKVVPSGVLSGVHQELEACKGPLASAHPPDEVAGRCRRLRGTARNHTSRAHPCPGCHAGRAPPVASSPTAPLRGASPGTATHARAHTHTCTHTHTHTHAHTYSCTGCHARRAHTAFSASVLLRQAAHPLGLCAPMTQPLGRYAAWRPSPTQRET